jgi:hypothetical protein
VEGITKSVALEVAVDYGIGMCQCKIGVVEKSQVGGGLLHAVDATAAPLRPDAPRSRICELSEGCAGVRPSLNRFRASPVKCSHAADTGTARFRPQWR